jgi:hypothetical protein
MTPYNSIELSYFHYLILNLTVLSKYSEDLLEEWVKLDWVNILFKALKLQPEKEFSIYFIITYICDDKQIETLNEFNSVILKYADFLKKTANDFKNNAFKRDSRLMMINGEAIDVVTHTLVIDKVNSALGTVLKSLYKLSLNDKIKNVIYYEQKIKDDLKVILLKGNEYETIFSLDLFIQLSFNEKIAEDLSKDEEIKTFVCTENQNEKIKKKIESLKWNLFKKNATESSKNQSNEKLKTQHIMISYNTTNRELVLKIKERLESYGFKIWIDINDIHGSSLESMANAIENSFVVLICISERYRESINCQAEAQYAFKLKKPIIPLILQKGFENVSGWLGILMGDKIFINFTKYELEECFRRLKHEVDSKLEKPILANSIEKNVELKTSDVILEKTNQISKAESMNEAECKLWFESKKIDPQILVSLGGSCDGKILKQIWEMKQRDPQFYDQSLKSINLNFFSIAKYSAALEELFRS